MFRQIRMHLYRFGIIELTDILDILEYIKRYNIDPYELHKRVSINTVTNNIVDYTNEIRKINKTNLIEEYVIVKPITMNNVIDVTLDKWFSDGTYMVKDTNLAYQEWLDEVTIIITENMLMSKNIHNGKLGGNSIKIRPYIINIEKIVGIIFKECVT